MRQQWGATHSLLLELLGAPLILRGPACICLPDVCSFPSTCELPTFPLKSKPRTLFLLTSRWQISLNRWICQSLLSSSGVPNVHTYSHRSLPSLNLSHVYLLIRSSRKAEKSRRKIICPTLHCTCSVNPESCSLYLKMSHRILPNL